MRKSYIKPRSKSAITPEILLTFTFFSITLAMLLLTYAFLLSKNYSFVSGIEDVKEERITLEKNLEKMKDEIAYVEKQKQFAQGIHTQNSVLRDSIANLFDLVPQRITLSEAKLLKNGLILYGITPSKDVYNFMLHAPLRSIFSRTYSSFYPAGNGWLRFVSTNYSDEEEFESEN
jgi:cell division protein FtsB